jgi:hypothetical protein
VELVLEIVELIPHIELRHELPGQVELAQVFPQPG